MTETVDEGPRFITDVEIVTAMRQDSQCLAAIQDRPVERGIPPRKQYVDQAYMSGHHIADSLNKGIDLRGYVREGNLSKPVGFRLRGFEIDIEQRRAICLAGKKQPKWVRARLGIKSLIRYHVQFSPQCRLCPHFGPGLCTDEPNGRYLGINAYHGLIQPRRLEVDTEAFRQDMKIRAGIEGTVSETVRGYGLLRPRFRGTRKTQVQALFWATATDLKRLARSSFLCTFIRSQPLYLSTPQTV